MTFNADSIFVIWCNLMANWFFCDIEADTFNRNGWQ